MSYISPTVQPRHAERARGATVVDEQQALMRGLVNGVVISLIVWTAALCLVLALR